MWPFYVLLGLVKFTVEIKDNSFFQSAFAFIRLQGFNVQVLAVNYLDLKYVQLSLDCVIKITFYLCPL